MGNTYYEENKDYITQTKLKSFNYCQYRYFLEWIEGKHKEKESTESMILGTILDDYLSLGEKEFWKNKSRK